MGTGGEGKGRGGEGRGEQGKFEGGEGRVKMELLQLQLVLYVVFRKKIEMAKERLHTLPAFHPL